MHFKHTNEWGNWIIKAKQLRKLRKLYGKYDRQHRMTRNRCTALCAALHSETDRGRDGKREKMERER